MVIAHVDSYGTLGCIGALFCPLLVC